VSIQKPLTVLANMAIVFALAWLDQYQRVTAEWRSSDDE
jgi:hypothetical protein